MHDLDRWTAEGETLPVVGWDASPVAGRWIARHPPWDLRSILRDRLSTVGSLLDLGTGGGEFLASLVPLPRRTTATEGYPPNLPVARRRLEGLGVRVLPIAPDNRLPMPDRSVELVLSRHEEFDPREVRRVLVPGGAFVTQQVGAANYAEINRRLRATPGPATNAVGSVRELSDEVAAAGLAVSEAREARFEDTFRDIGALVWYLRFAPWQVPGFSVERFRAPLESLHREMGRTGGFAVTAHRLLLIARRRDPD